MVGGFGRFGRIPEAAFPGGDPVRALMITCVEGCLPAGAAERQFEPEGLMVLRNPANLVPPEDDEQAEALALALARGAREIVVYGHAGCGMIGRLLDDQAALQDLGLAAWLAPAEGVREAVRALPPGEQHLHAVEWNISQQLSNLTTRPAVAAAVLTGRVALRGWMYAPPLDAVLAACPSTRRLTRRAALDPEQNRLFLKDRLKSGPSPFPQRNLASRYLA